MASTNPKIPIVKNGELRRFDGTFIRRIGTSGWFDWLQLDSTKSFQYHGESGQYATVCKEKRIGGGGEPHYYFIAYRSIKGKKKRVYLGKARRLTLLRLEKAAGKLAQLALDAEKKPDEAPPREAARPFDQAPQVDRDRQDRPQPVQSTLFNSV